MLAIYSAFLKGQVDRQSKPIRRDDDNVGQRP
jgi:hypothetical protein